MIYVVIAVFTLCPKYTSVYLCIRVNIMTFIEQQQQRLSVHFVDVFLYSMMLFCKELVIFNISLVLLVKLLLSLNE